MYRVHELSVESLVGAHISFPNRDRQVFEVLTSDNLHIYGSNVETRQVLVFQKSEVYQVAELVDTSATRAMLKHEVFKKMKGGFSVLSLVAQSPNWEYFVNGQFEGSSDTEFKLLVNLCKP